jgi:cell division protein FtsL
MKKIKNKKISLFNLMVMLFLLAGVIIFYVHNIIAVNNIVEQNDILKNEINKTVAYNNNLSTEIERLSNLDNIKPVAAEKLGLKFSESKPKKITVHTADLEISK